MRCNVRAVWGGGHYPKTENPKATRVASCLQLSVSDPLAISPFSLQAKTVFCSPADHTETIYSLWP